MQITEEYLRNLGACQGGINLWLTEKEPDPFRCIDRLMKIERYNYATWLIAYSLTPRDAAKFAIYSAKQVLPIYEEKHPEDNRIRETIKAAEQVLKNPTEMNINEAISAADVADLIAYPDVFNAHVSAALPASYAARAAAALSAPITAKDAYPAANNAISANSTIKNKIILYGKKLLRKQLKGE